MRKRLVHPRQAQDEPHGKVSFTFLGGLACDLEGVGAGARHLSNSKVILSYLLRKAQSARLSATSYRQALVKCFLPSKALGL